MKYKMILVLILVLNCFKILPHSGYVDNNGKVSVYRKLDTISLGIGATVGAFYSVLGIIMHASIPSHKRLTEGKAVVRVTGTFALGSLGLGCYAFMNSLSKQDEPILKLSDEGLYFEEYGSYLWQELGFPIVVEDIRGVKVFSRSLWIPIISTGNYIKIEKYCLDINFETLLLLVSKYKSIQCFSENALNDDVPLHLQNNLSDVQRNKILATPMEGHTTTLLKNCIRKEAHTCACEDIPRDYLNKYSISDLIEKSVCLWEDHTKKD